MSAALSLGRLGAALHQVRRRIQCALLRQRIRWAQDQLELSAHYLEIEPIRHRWLAGQIRALEVELIQLRGAGRR